MIGSHFGPLVQRHGLSKRQVLYIGIQNEVFISQSMNRTCYWSGNHYTATWIVIPVLLCHWFCLGDVDSIVDSAVIHYAVWVTGVFHRLKTNWLDRLAANSTQEWMHTFLMWNTHAWAACGVDACWPCARMCLAGPKALSQAITRMSKARLLHSFSLWKPECMYMYLCCRKTVCSAS